jgi:amino acid transporter
MSQQSRQVRLGAPAPADGGNAEGPPDGPGPDQASRKPLGLFDAVSIIVGIVVGAGIFRTAPDVFQQVSDPYSGVALWAVGGMLSLIGALCYAELATTYPRTGGDYVYLGRAFGPWLGFLFGWVQLTVLMTGSIGMMAFIFADYFAGLLKAFHGIPLQAPPGTSLPVTWHLFGMEISEDLITWLPATLVVAALTVANIAGVVFGKTIQNLLTVAKVLGLVLLLSAGFVGTAAPEAWSVPDGTPAPPVGVGLALVFVLYTFGGWNDSAFVAAEVRDGKRNITRALILGILIVTALYVVVNIAYVRSLGFVDARNAGNQIAAVVLGRVVGGHGASLMCVLVMVSALGALNGLIFTGARVYSTVGRDHPVFHWMGAWDRGRGTPIPALVTQGLITILFIFLVGTAWGRAAVNEVVKRLGMEPGRWEGQSGFDILLACTAPIFWLFFMLTGFSLYVLRERDRDVERPFKAPFYPEVPLIFCATCAYMCYSSTGYALFRGGRGGLLLLSVLPVLLGLPVYRLSRLLAGSSAARPPGPAGDSAAGPP